MSNEIELVMEKIHSVYEYLNGRDGGELNEDKSQIRRILKDAIAKAHAEGRVDGLREAAGIAKLRGATLGSTVSDAILAAIPSPVPDREDRCEWRRVLGGWQTQCGHALGPCQHLSVCVECGRPISVVTA